MGTMARCVPTAASVCMCVVCWQFFGAKSACVQKSMPSTFSITRATSVVAQEWQLPDTARPLCARAYIEGKGLNVFSMAGQV